MFVNEPFTKYGVGILIGQIFLKKNVCNFLYISVFVYNCVHHIKKKRKNGKMVKMKNDFFCIVTKGERKVLKKKGYVFFFIYFLFFGFSLFFYFIYF